MEDNVSSGSTMYQHFTDAENTGAPMVPDLTGTPPRRRESFAEHEEAILSHRITH